MTSILLNYFFDNKPRMIHRKHLNIPISSVKFFVG